MNGELLPDAAPEISVRNTNGPLKDLAAPSLAPEEIHVWEISLAVAEAALAAQSSVLSADESQRATRFHFERDRRRFTVARSSLRTILGLYTAKPPAELKFDYAKQGKPALAEPHKDIRFNLSHSGELAMIAIALGHEIGVDVEAINTDVETDKLAQRFFSEQERAKIREFPPEKRVQAFYRCWTCKEAFLKGQGFGLSRSLGSFDVEVDPDRPARLLATRPDVEEAAQWSLHDIETDTGYASAVAAEFRFHSITLLRHRP